MRKLTFILTILLALPAFAGREGGGLYKYERTSLAHFRVAILNLNRGLSGIPQKKWEENWEVFGVKPPSIDEFRAVLYNIIYAPLEERTRTSPDGYERPLAMDYSLNPKSIIILKPMFEEFNKVELTKKDLFYLYKSLIHETTHTFGVGIHDDQMSRILSLFIYEDTYLGIDKIICGANGDLAKRRNDCLLTFKNKYPYVSSQLHETTLHFEELRNVLINFGPTKAINNKKIDQFRTYCKNKNKIPGASTFRMLKRSEAIYLAQEKVIKFATFYDQAKNTYYAVRASDDRREPSVRKIKSGLFNKKGLYQMICVAEVL